MSVIPVHRRTIQKISRQVHGFLADHRPATPTPEYCLAEEAVEMDGDKAEAAETDGKNSTKS